MLLPLLSRIPGADELNDVAKHDIIEGWLTLDRKAVKLYYVKFPQWMNIGKFWYCFHWSLFLVVWFMRIHNWFRSWLGTEQATDHYLQQWWHGSAMHMCITWGNELILCHFIWKQARFCLKHYDDLSDLLLQEFRVNKADSARPITYFNDWRNHVDEKRKIIHYMSKFLVHMVWNDVIIVALKHDDVIKWKHFPRYWPYVRGIHWSPVNSPHKGRWRESLMFSLICPWINGWVNNREAGDLRRHRTHYDVTVKFYRWCTEPMKFQQTHNVINT